MIKSTSRPSVMNHKFSEVPNVEIPRSTFDRSHGLKTVFDAGLLIPILVDEALPGDTFNVNMTGFARLATPIFPIFDNMYMDTFFFSVPNRLIWDNWQRFMGEQDNPGDSIDYIIPRLQYPGAGGYVEESLFDYMGLPTKIAGDFDVSALPFRAYNLIWNEWFRDQNLQDSVTVNKGDAADALTDYTILRRGKRHDYFTAALPSPQKGDAVSIPLGDTAPLTITGDGTPTFDSATAGFDDEALWHNGDNALFDGYAGGGNAVVTWNDPALAGTADLSTATAVTVNVLRQGFQIQRLLERDARGGTRYTEILRSHFGVTSPDQRLQRPEYLGGGSSPVIFNPVAQTSATFGPAAQGNLAAYGTAMLMNHGFKKAFVEHCTIIGLVCVRADLNYQQGLNRMFSRKTRYDFYFPSLSHIGEQAVLNKEIFTAGDQAAGDDLPFGYQERYGEYRYKPSLITGAFRSNHSTPLDSWHLAQDFATLPALNDEFIQENPPVDRIIAVQDEPHILFDAHFSMLCARPMPLYGVPGFIDHF